jgi:hypothetical protein
MPHPPPRSQASWPSKNGLARPDECVVCSMSISTGLVGASVKFGLAPNMVHGVDQTRIGILTPSQVSSGFVFLQPQLAVLAK